MTTTNMIKQPIIKLIGISIVVIMLSACQLIRPASPYAQFNIQSAHFLNPDIHNQPAPLVLTIYQLRDPHKFNTASYRELAANSAKILGTNLIDQHTLEIRPATHMTLTQKLAPNTKYLGIVAAYRQINQATWKRLIKIDNTKSKTTTINLELEAQAISIKTKIKPNSWLNKLSRL